MLWQPARNVNCAITIDKFPGIFQPSVSEFPDNLSLAKMTSAEKHLFIWRVLTGCRIMGVY
jgi:hypothetical protein